MPNFNRCAEVRCTHVKLIDVKINDHKTKMWGSNINRGTM